MTPERWRQIEELYHSARERGAGILADADPELRREVEQLLAQGSEGGKLLDQSVGNLLAGIAAPSIAAGTRLGPYRIEAPLGQGGMGQVFRATDTRLGRTVAIKISHERFSSRFEQESRAIAALNHPHICTLHDVGPNYLVMELIEGETLAARLKRGTLSSEQTITIGTQIADALAAAHAKGIVHRDLKPANVMLAKSGVKVLDFGLAKTVTDAGLTAAGVVVGTPAYMAPEQSEGRPADARTDIYALGLMLGEMLTGKRSEPCGGAAPPAVARVVKRCLESDADERWQSARDVKWALESATVEFEAAPARSRSLAFPAAVALAVLLAAALAYVFFGRTVPPQQAARMSVLLAANSRPLAVAVSPDGRTFAMVLVKDGRQQVWVRPVDAVESTALEGTDGADNPFWSPDGRSIGFFADAKLKKIDRSGGPVQMLCDALGAVGGSWNRNGEIIIGGLNGVLRIASAGGPVSEAPARTPVREIYPYFLPDGEHYLATRPALNTADMGVWLGSILAPDSRRILPDVSNAEFMGPPPGSRIGAVIFGRGNALMALPFDMQQLEAAGDVFPITKDMGANNADYYRLMAASNAGVLAYVAGQQGGNQYVWRDRQGRNLGSYPDAGGEAVISPDGTRLAGDRGGEMHDIWVMELARGTATRLTFQPPINFNPIWSPDSRYVVYNKLGAGIFRKLANGAGGEELLVPTKLLAAPTTWSPDGRFLVYSQINPGTGADLMAIAVDGDRQPFTVAQTPATENQGQFSPDGHWLAYTSNESGQGEVYVIPFPPSAGARWMVSRGGGVQPRWRRNGKELLYISPDSKMMSAEVATAPVFQSGTPHALFQTDIVDTGIRIGPMSWDLAPDGERFLIITPNASEMPALTVALNWRTETGK